MKLFNNEYTFSEPWETVVQAAARKYPNPQNRSVTGVDVIDRRLDSNGVLFSHRLLKTEWNLDSFSVPMPGALNTGFVSEHTVTDPVNRIMTLRSRNLNGTNWFAVDETMIYKAHPTDPSKTLMTQSIAATVKTSFLRDAAESVAIDSIQQKAKLGLEAMETVINKIKEEALHTQPSAL